MNRRVISLSVAAFLTVFSITAFAGLGTSPSKETQRETQNEVNSKITLLTGGETVKIAGDRMFIIQGGKETPAKDGTYQLRDGTKLRITGGRITETIAPGPAMKSKSNVLKRM